LTNIPRNIKNPEIYIAYLNLLKKVIADNDHHLNNIWKLKKSRLNFDYNPQFSPAQEELNIDIFRFFCQAKLLFQQADCYITYINI